MSSQGDAEELRTENKALCEEVERLRQELDRVKRERIEYLQNVSHQLVAPLNAIKWHIENLTSARVGVERAKKVMRSVYSQATIAVHLAKNFALMSSLEADHSLKALREPLEPIAPSRLLVNLADDFQPLAWDKSVNIAVDKSSFTSVPDVLMMKPLMSQVFGNIIENAVKYSDDGSDITIHGSYDRPTDSVAVQIISRGASIGSHELEKIFERGYRGSNATEKYPAGTGFGLYIAKKIVDIHRGRVRAFTGRNGRTVFEVSLPVKGLKGLGKQWPARRS